MLVASMSGWWFGGILFFLIWVLIAFSARTRCRP